MDLQEEAGEDADLGAGPHGKTYYVLSPTIVFETLEDVLGGADPAGSLATGAVIFALEQVQDDAGRQVVLFAHGDSTLWAATVDAWGADTMVPMKVVSIEFPVK